MFFETNGTIPFFLEKLLAVSKMKQDSQNINWEDKSLGHERPNLFLFTLVKKLHQHQPIHKLIVIGCTHIEKFSL
jgi:hypothetical protein